MLTNDNTRAANYKPPGPRVHGPKPKREGSCSIPGLTAEGLRTLRKQGRGPASYKIGRCVRFSLADPVAFAESNRTPVAGDACAWAAVSNRSEARDGIGVGGRND